MITGLALALLTWPLPMGLPGAGLDFSWAAGLYMAVEQGKHFGTEVIFTYGPLGFLDWPMLWYSWLAFFAYLWFGLTYVALTVLLTWTISRTAGLAAAAVVVFLVMVAFNFLGDIPLLIAVGIAYTAMREDRPGWALPVLVIGGALLCAIEPLAKLSTGPPSALILILAMLGARAGRRQWAAFGAVAVVGFFAAWFLTGQGLANLPDYVANGIQVIEGYNEAMSQGGAETWEAVAMITISVVLIAFIHRARFRDARAKWFATAATAVVVYVMYKYGTTQFLKNGPPVVDLATLLAVFLFAPWSRRRAVPFLAGAGILIAIIIHSFPATPNLDVVDKLETFKGAAELEIRPGLRQEKIDISRSSLQESLAVPQSVLDLIGHKPVAIEPWEISVAWAYGLNWRPLPVFQSYTAYTEKLDRVNSDAIRDADDGPQLLLRQTIGNGPGQGRPPFLNRLSVWDPPEQNVATVCNFVPVLTEEKWQVLTRIPNRCEAPEPISTEAAAEGQVVKVPAAGHDEVVVMRVKGAKIDGLEKLGSLFWRPRERRIVLGGPYTYRLIPGTSEDGMIVSIDRTLDRGETLPELPAIKHLAIEGAGGSLEYSFERIKLKPIRLVPKKIAGEGAG